MWPSHLAACSLSHLWNNLDWLGHVDSDGLLSGGVGSDVGSDVGGRELLRFSADVLGDGVPLLLVSLDGLGELRDGLVVVLVLLSEHLVDLGSHVGLGGLIGGGGLVGECGLVGLGDDGGVGLLGQESGLLLWQSLVLNMMIFILHTLEHFIGEFEIVVRNLNIHLSYWFRVSFVDSGHLLGLIGQVAWLRHLSMEIFARNQFESSKQGICDWLPPHTLSHLGLVLFTRLIRVGLEHDNLSRVALSAGIAARGLVRSNWSRRIL